MFENRKVFWCDCGDMSHSLVVEKDGGETNVFYQMRTIWPWYTRLWVALNYVFKRDVKYHHGDIVLTKTEKDRLIEFLQE